MNLSRCEFLTGTAGAGSAWRDRDMNCGEEMGRWKIGWALTRHAEMFE